MNRPICPKVSFVQVGPNFVAFLPSRRMTATGVRREKAALSCGLKPHPAKAPAGSNRSGHGGNDMAEAFG